MGIGPEQRPDSGEAILEVGKFRLMSYPVLRFSREDKRAIKHQLRSGYDGVLGAIRSNPDGLLKRVAEIAEKKWEKKLPSRPKRTVDIMVGLLMESMDQLRDRLAGVRGLGDMQGIAAGYDFTMGGVLTAGSITLAEDELRIGSGKTAETIMDLAREVGTLPTVSPAVAEMYAAINHDAQSYARFLREDPTGIRLIDHVASQYNNAAIARTKVPFYMEWEFVGAGANFAANFYKNVYPLSDRFGT